MSLDGRELLKIREEGASELLSLLRAWLIRRDDRAIMPGLPNQPLETIVRAFVHQITGRMLSACERAQREETEARVRRKAFTHRPRRT